MTLPELTQSLVVDILQGFWRSRKNLIIPVYAGQRGYPIIIGEPLYPKLEKVSSLESLAESCPDEVHEVMFPEAGLVNSPLSASRSSVGLHP
jgi:CTP:molybdopterin cytidylyltransferase MocA